MNIIKSELIALLRELDSVYSKSDINKFCSENDYEWFYSLITTTLERDGPLVLGFNWGVSGNERYKPQVEIKKTNFEFEDMGSLTRIRPYCEKYFGKSYLSNVSQSNYCFFRSKIEAQISKKDIQLCEPIFKKMVSILSPSSILCFSSKLRDFLIANNEISSMVTKEVVYKRGIAQVTYTATKAILISGIEIRFLPHPNYPMKGEARDAAWEFCCGS